MAEPTHPGLDAAIAALWRDAAPRALGRVETLERAIGALRDGTLDPAAAAEATREAHKLAGALGTFGMPDGTRHARAVERRLAAGPVADDAAGLAAEVAALRAVVEAGPTAA